MSKNTVSSVYKLLMRARADAFRGDSRALAASRTEIRSKFEEQRDERDAARVEELLKEVRSSAGAALRLRRRRHRRRRSARAQAFSGVQPAVCSRTRLAGCGRSLFPA